MHDGDALQTSWHDPGMLLLIAALLAPQDAGVQKVVAAISAAARENAAKEEEQRATGDALTDLYIRRACGSGQPADAIVLGIAYSLEPTGVLAKNPLAGNTFEDAESADERKARLAAMGRPTLRGREDWLAHFVVSAGLAVIVGEPTAEAVGIQKEATDANAKETGAGTGFSFTDLNADFAGIAFAKWLIGGKSRDALEVCGKSFEAANFVPDPKGLADGLTWTEFEKEWGGVKDPKFRAECQRLRARVQGCKGYGAR